MSAGLNTGVGSLPGGSSAKLAVEECRGLWLQVCASRGTPAPDPARLAAFIEGLGVREREKLETVLALAARGRERQGDLGLISWAAACTRPALLDLLKSHGLAFTGARLFACGLALSKKGWNMQPRLAQLANNPEDAATLRAWLPAVPGEPGEPEADPQALAAPGRSEEAALDAAFYPWPDDDGDDGPSGGYAPGWEGGGVPGGHAGLARHQPVGSPARAADPV